MQIPELEFEIPPESQRGTLSTVFFLPPHCFSSRLQFAASFFKFHLMENFKFCGDVLYLPVCSDTTADDTSYCFVL